MLKTFGRDNLLIMISLLVWALGEGLWINLRQILLRDLGASPQEVGLALGVESVSRSLLLIPTGYIIDRFGPRAVLVVGWAMGVICAALMALAPTWPLFTLGLSMYATTAFVIPAISAYALTAAPSGSDPQRVLSTIFASFPLGMAVSPALGGWLAGLIGSIRGLLWIAMGMYALSTLFMALIRHQAPHPRQEKFHFRRLWSNASFVGYSLFFAFSVLALLISFVMLPNFMEEARSLSIETIGGLFSVFAVGTTSINLLMARIGRRWSFPLALAIAWLSALILWLVSAPIGIGVGFFFLGAVYCIRPAVLARLEWIIAPEDRGMAFSVVEILFALATAVAATAAGQLFALTPAHDLPLIATIIAVPVILLIWFGLRLGRLPVTATPAPAAAGDR